MILPKSMMANLPSVVTRRLPGWGSAWKKPVSRSWMRKHSTPTGMSLLITEAGEAASLTPSIHSVTNTLRS